MLFMTSNKIHSLYKSGIVSVKIPTDDHKRFCELVVTLGNMQAPACISLILFPCMSREFVDGPCQIAHYSSVPCINELDLQTQLLAQT